MSKLRFVNFVVILAATGAVGLAIWRGLDVRDFLEENTRPAYAGWMMMLLGSYLFLPVPSSILMTTNGHWFGPTVGIVISFSSSMIAWISWYWLGRSLGWSVLDPALGRIRSGSKAQPRWLLEHLSHLGIALLIVSRPMPVLAGVVAGAAGAMRMNWWKFLLGTALGVLPMAMAYALFGHFFGPVYRSPLVLAIAVGAPALLYLLVASQLRQPRNAPKDRVTPGL